MQKTNKTHAIGRCLDWWIQGLKLPFPLKVAERWVVNQATAENEVRLTSSDQTVSMGMDALTRFSGNSRRRKLYLAVPEHAIISIVIPHHKRAAPLDEVVAQLIPFDLTELWYGASSDGSRIDAVLKQELAAQIKRFQALDIDLSGLAFMLEGDSSFIELDGLNAIRPLTTNERMHSQRWPKGVCLALLVLIGLGSYWWLIESRLQSDLQQKLVKFGSQDSLLSDTSAVLPLDNGISLADSIAYLETLAESLSADAVADQVILTDNTLLLDMRARSASLIRANVDAGGLSVRSEFISSISTDNEQDMERFRLKLHLVEPRSLDASGFDDD